jgi:tetratricopeptide (TPR) repeat protein
MNSQPPLPNNEIARLEALYQYQILETPPEKGFDDCTFLAAQICQTPIALISLLDGNRQWFKSKMGLTVSQTSRDVAFCAYTILQQKPTVVKNALADSRFATNPLVTSDPNIRFYAGAPLITPEGFAIGTLCVIDVVPRDLSPEQVEGLRVLSHQVMAQFEMRRNVMMTSHTIMQRLQDSQQLRYQQQFIDSFYHRGMDKARRGDFQGAITDFNQFLQLNPNGIKAYYRRGVARRELGDNMGALADFDIYLRVNSNDPEAYYNRGLLRFELGDNYGAMADYTQAMKLNPNYVVDNDDLSLTRSQSIDNQKALRFDTPFLFNPGFPLADKNHLNHEFVLEEKHDYLENLNPNNIRMNNGQDDTNLDIKDHIRAIADYTQALWLNPNDAEAYKNRGLVYSRLEYYHEAIEDYTHSLQLNPDDAVVYYSRGYARFKLKDYMGAIADYTQAVQLNPNDPTAYYYRGLAYAEIEDYRQAVEDYTQVVQLNPNDATAYLSRAVACLKLEDYERAIVDSTNSLKLEPNDATAYLNRGHARSKLKDFRGALEDYKRAREISTTRMTPDNNPTPKLMSSHPNLH